MKSYLDATRHACDKLENQIIDGKWKGPGGNFAENLTYRVAGLELISEEGELYWSVSKPIGIALIKLAGLDFRFFDFCSEICALNIQLDKPLPEPLRLFACARLIEDMPRPTPSHRPRKNDFFEKAYTYWLIKELAETFELSLTRNEASAALSACDAVAEALSICGKATKYSELKDLMTHPDKEQIRNEIQLAYELRRKTEAVDVASLPEEAQYYYAYLIMRDILSTFPRHRQKSN